MSTISLCMIVCNEENILEKCLSSVIELVDEIIIVDTGSTDKTVKIARKFVDKVYHFQWIDDFAAARNYAESLATCDYIFRFDADCTLQCGDMKKLLEIKSRNFDNADLFNLNYIEKFEVEGSGVVKPLFEESLFFFYRRNMFHWECVIHNNLILNNNKIKPVIKVDNSILVLHHREEAAKNWRKKQTLGILKRNVNKRNQNYQRILYFYARELYFDKNYKESIIQFQYLLKEKITADLRLYAIEKIFFAIFESGQTQRIIEFQHLLYDDTSPRIKLLIADILCLSDPSQALQYYQQYNQLPFLQKDTIYEYDIERFQIHPLVQIAKLQIHKGCFSQSKSILNIALDLSVTQESKTRIKKLLEFC
jgi:glycosyltransferase involved in cell wall biosynthesis